MTFSDKLKSAGYELIAPEKQELLNDAKKLDKNINTISPLQKSINNLIEKITISKTGKERFILEEQLDEFKKINILYKKFKTENYTRNTQKEINKLLSSLELQINLKENKLEDDSINLETIIINEENKLEDTIDMITPNTIRDTVEKYIDIKGKLESIPKKKYQDFFDIATITYIDLLENIETNNLKLNENQIDFLVKNKGLYLDGNSIHIYIKELIKKLKNTNLNFEFEIQLNKAEYNKIYTINLEKYKKKLEQNEKIKLEKLRKIQEENKKIKLKKLREIQEENSILDKATDLIIKHEGFSQISKWDKKQYSRGYGTKAPGKGLKITKEKAKIELKNKIIKNKKYIEKYFPNITDNQIIALISFFYNTGLSSKGKENLIWRLKRMNTYVKGIGFIKPKSIANMMLEYANSGGKRLPGLIKRRKEEVKYFLKM